MKIKSVLMSLLVVFLVASCKPAPLAMTSSPNSADSLPRFIQNISLVGDVKPYDDVRWKSFMGYQGEVNCSLIETLWFNEQTLWQEDVIAIAQEVMEEGKNPGLGVRSLHEQGITGKGVTVAIIDQNLGLDHPEYAGKILQYKDVGTGQPATESSMHAPAVTSLLVGDTIGTAPDARVYFAAAPSWTGDAQFQADALNWIIDENAKLPADSKIRLVSVSAAPSGPESPFDKNNAAWDAAYERANEAGILVLDCTTNHGITAPCYLDPTDPEDPTQCTPGWPGMDYSPDVDRIYIPTSLRTTAEEYSQGNFSYQFTGQGGLSWSIPYLAGVLAMGWQVNPDLSNEQILDLLFASAYTRESGEKIINPKAFIERVKGTVSK